MFMILACHRWCCRSGLAYGLLLVWLVTLSGCAEAPDDQTLARRGLEAVDFFDFTTGMNKLMQVQPDWPMDDPQWLEITYALAVSAWHASPPRAEWIELAESLFTLIAEEEGYTTVGVAARMNLARLAEIIDFPGDVPDYETAKAIYMDILERRAGQDVAMQAALRLANLQAYTLTEEGAQAGVALIQHQLELNPDSPWASVGWQYLGDMYIHFLQDRAAALDAYAEAYRLGFANVPRSDAYLWRMGQFAEELERKEEALRWYRVLIVDHPRSIFGTWAHQHMTRIAATMDEPVDIPPPPNPLEIL